MQLNTRPNEWVQYIFQLQFMVQSCRDQDRVRTFVLFNQLSKISNLESITS
jgi:hypothetical protein